MLALRTNRAIGSFFCRRFLSSTSTTSVVHRIEDYTPPPYLVRHVDLQFQLGREETRVRSTLHLSRSVSALPSTPLVLNKAKELIPENMQLNYWPVLSSHEMQVEEEQIVINNPPNTPNIVIESEFLLNPSENKALEGLYASGDILVTQCEPEGFRRIIAYPDRPDVMSTFTVTLVANKSEFPVLLSNGNLLDKGDLPNDSHFVVYHDPYPKPSYLFAVCAGKMDCVEGQHIKPDGSAVDLRIFVDPGNGHKCSHAMASLKHAMEWDEKVYGRVYDLDVYNIVATRFFNMGAMENKSLNIFNDKYILASAETATDADFLGVETVVAHEYFHNWSGNRVTCRDWFQLSLKEGFTVYRDQEFSRDMLGRGYRRVLDAIKLQSIQFAEDDGPLSHPVRPSTYREINNFYTATVYDKGAEVVSMLSTLVGRDRFREGTDLYFSKFDGKAVTCDDFVDSVQEKAPTGLDLSQFRLWYSVAGTPIVSVKSEYNSQNKTFTLRLKQSIKNKENAPALHIPLLVALINPSTGEEWKGLPNELNANAQHSNVSLSGRNGEVLLQLRNHEQTFVFSNVESRPVLSFLRSFSAPVRVQYEEPRTLDDAAALVRFDSDEYAKWDALSFIQTTTIVSAIKSGNVNLPDSLLNATKVLLEQCCNSDKGRLLIALMMRPSIQRVWDSLEVVDPVLLSETMAKYYSTIASQLSSHLERVFNLAEPDAADISATAMGTRAVRSAALWILNSQNATAKWSDMSLSVLSEFKNMTDTRNALEALLTWNNTSAQANGALTSFLTRYSADPLAMNAWLRAQAITSSVDKVQSLMSHSSFQITNPNNVYALLGGFAAENRRHFHAADGSGYRFVAEEISKIDAFNPIIASRLARMFAVCPKLNSHRQQLIVAELSKIVARDGISSALREVADSIISVIPK